VADPATSADPAGAPDRDRPEPGARGRLTIAEKAVESVACQAAREVSGVVSGASSAGSRRFSGEYPRASAHVAGTHARVGVEVAVRWAVPLAPTAAAVRDRVAERVRTLLDLQPDRVDVVVPELVTESGRTL